MANVLVVARTEGADLLTYDRLSDLYALQTEIDDIRVTYEGQTYGLQDICLQPAPGQPCVVSSVLDYWNYQNGPHDDISDNLVPHPPYPRPGLYWFRR